MFVIRVGTKRAYGNVVRRFQCKVRKGTEDCQTASCNTAAITQYRNWQGAASEGGRPWDLNRQPSISY
jgi:hypothetical protein